MDIKYLTILIPLVSTHSLASQHLRLEATPKIVNGIYSKKEHIPWQVMIASGLCGGTIIDKQWVLSAAHCFHHKDIDFSNVQIGAGGTAFEYKEQKSDLTYYNIDKIIVHPEYNYDKNINDIALVKIPDSEAFPSNSQIKLISGAEQTIMDRQFQNEWVDNQKRPANLVASGWGSTDPFDKYNYDPRLKQTLLSGVPIKTCITMTNNFLQQDVSNKLKDVLCAMSPDPQLITDTGEGDSGGPLVWQNPSHKDDKDKGLRLVGATSYSFTTGSNQAPTYYAKVAIYRDWIEKEIGKDLNSIPVSTFAHDPFTQDYSAAPAIKAVDIVRPTSPTSGSGGSTSAMGLLALFGLLWRKIQSN